MEQNKRYYTYQRYGANDAYGQPTLLPTSYSVKMAISGISQQINGNILYPEASYIGFTNNNAIDDNCVVNYGAHKLKVLYVNKTRNYNLVYMQKAK